MLTDEPLRVQRWMIASHSINHLPRAVGQRLLVSHRTHTVSAATTYAAVLALQGVPSCPKLECQWPVSASHCARARKDKQAISYAIWYVSILHTM